MTKANFSSKKGSSSALWKMTPLKPCFYVCDPLQVLRLTVRDVSSLRKKQLIFHLHCKDAHVHRGISKTAAVENLPKEKRDQVWLFQRS